MIHVKKISSELLIFVECIRENQHFQNKGADFMIHSSFLKKVCKTHERYTVFSNRRSNFEDPYHTLKTDPLFRVGEMKVTCRKCDRGARNPLSASAADPGVALAWAPIGKGIPFPSSEKMLYVMPKRAHAATSCRGPIYPLRGPGRGVQSFLSRGN